MRKLILFFTLILQSQAALNVARSITIDHTKCGGTDSVNFPVLVSLSDSTLKLLANGGHIEHQAQPLSGTGSSTPSAMMPTDLIFAADSAGATKYPWEVEFYDGTNGILVAWVKIPTVSHTVNTQFWMLYEDVAITTPQNVGAFVPANVWDANYQLVTHLSDQFGGCAFSSSFCTTNSASPFGNPGLSSTSGVTIVSGQIASAFNFNPTLLANVNADNLGTNNGAITVETWYNGANLLTIQDLISKGFDGTNTAFELAMQTTGKLYWRAYNGSVQGVANSTATLSTATWYHLVGIYSSGTGTWSLYINGALDSSVNTGGIGPQSTNQSYNLGAVEVVGSPSTFLSGNLDESRISNSARSPDYVLQSYNNQFAPGNIGAANFLIIGNEQSPGGPQHQVVVIRQ